VHDLKSNFTDMQMSYSAAVVNLHSSIEAAKKSLGLHGRAALTSAGGGGAASGSASGSGAGDDPRNRLYLSDDQESELIAAMIRRAAEGVPGGGLSSAVSAPVGAPAAVGALSSSDLLDLFLNTPAVVSDTERLLRVLGGQGLGDTSPLAADAISFDASFPDAAHAGASRWRDRSVGAAAVPRGGGPAAAPSGASYVVPPSDSGLQAAVSPVSQPLSREGDAASMPPLSIDASHPPDAVVDLPLVPYEVESSRSLEHALNKLCSLDTILAGSIDFWGTMESVLMSLIQGKDHMQILLEHTTSKPGSAGAMLCAAAACCTSAAVLGSVSLSPSSSSSLSPLSPVAVVVVVVCRRRCR
jgi:hypothetical protein